LIKKIEASRFAKLSRITTTTSSSQNIQYVENDEMQGIFKEPMGPTLLHNTMVATIGDKTFTTTSQIA
jgi:hypothetical protein